MPLADGGGLGACVSPAEASTAFGLLAIVAVLALAVAWLVVMASLIRRRGRFR